LLVRAVSVSDEHISQTNENFLSELDILAKELSVIKGLQNLSNTRKTFYTHRVL